MNTLLNRVAVGVVAAAIVGTASADAPSQWDFNNSGSGLASSFGPGIMTVWTDDTDPNYVPGQTETQILFGSTSSFGINNIAGQDAGVMKIPAFFGWQGLFVDHQTPPNGIDPNDGSPGDYVNQYTLVFDVYITADQFLDANGDPNQWFPFHNTNCCNNNDADAYIWLGNGIGISGDYTGTFSPDTWHRVAFVYDLAQPLGQTNHWKYVDGVSIGSQALSGGIGFDGLFALYSPTDTDPDPYVGFHLFTEPLGYYVSEAYVNSVYYTDRALSEAEIAAFGAPDADGIAGGAPPCIGDLNGDNAVNLTDLAVLLANFGGAGTLAQGDITGDGQVDLTDLAQLLANFGTAC